METKEETTYYVYCHHCEKVLFKGPLSEAIRIECEKNHPYTFGAQWYYDKIYPEVVLED